ncbi:MAG: endo-1,4-beta-xylanase, partial [Clostridia bacterium]|nr:endo-1,4-beta-xylanase [Clostridia bacterium]
MKTMLEAYQKAYDALLPRINADIESYRKGDFQIRLTDKTGAPVSATVEIKQTGHAFSFGINALMIGAMGECEQAYRDAITDLFNTVTTTFCWGTMETEPGKYRFSEDSEEIYRHPPSDRVLRFAKENNLRVKGQPLFVGRWLPDWVPHDYEQLKSLWVRYVTEVAKHYDEEFFLFDVVNESYQ